MKTIDEEQLAIFTDLHLGIKKDSTLWHEIALTWCDWFVSELKKRNIKNVAFLGDFFHNRTSISVNTLHVASKILDKLSSFNLYFILGNHDLYYSEDFQVSAVKLFSQYPNVTIFEQEEEVYTPWGNILFSGWGYNPENYKRKTRYLFTHAEVNVFCFNEKQRACNTGLQASVLMNNFDIVLCGHFHSKQEKRWGDKFIRYTGNPFAMDYSDENVEKGFDILNLSTGNIEFIKNEISPIFTRIKLSELDNISTNELRERVKNSFFRLIIDKDISSDDSEKLLEEINIYFPQTSEIEWEYEKKIESNGQIKELDCFDLKSSIEEYIDSLEIDNKDCIKKYILQLFSSVEENV